MAQHLGTYRILAGTSILSSLCCIWFHRISDVHRRNPHVKRSRHFIITFSDYSLDHFQSLPSLIAKRKTDLKGVVSRETENRISDRTIETPLIAHGERIDYGTTTVQSSPSESTTTSPEEKSSLLNRNLVIIYLNVASLAFLDMAHFVLLPLFYSTSIPSGGLGLDPYTIGITLGSFGFVNATVQARLLGPLIRKFGARKMYIMCFPSFLACVTLYPIMRYFAQRFGRVNYIVAGCMTVQLGFQMLIVSSYGIIHL